MVRVRNTLCESRIYVHVCFFNFSYVGCIWRHRVPLLSRSGCATQVCHGRGFICKIENWFSVHSVQFGRRFRSCKAMGLRNFARWGNYGSRPFPTTHYDCTPSIWPDCETMDAIRFDRSTILILLLFACIIHLRKKSVRLHIRCVTAGRILCIIKLRRRSLSCILAAKFERVCDPCFCGSARVRSTVMTVTKLVSL